MHKLVFLTLLSAVYTISMTAKEKIKKQSTNYERNPCILAPKIRILGHAFGKDFF